MAEVALLRLLAGGELPSESPGFVSRHEEDEEKDDDGEVPSLHIMTQCWHLAEAWPRDHVGLEQFFRAAWRVCTPSAGSQLTLKEEEAQELLDLANSSLGPTMQGYIDRLERGGEAIGWSFKSGAEDGRPFRVERPIAKPAKIICWHAVHPSGLGGMFTSGLGLIEHCARRGQALLIDWSNRGLLYHGHKGSNMWDEFFTQPATALLSQEEIREAQVNGDVHHFHGTPCMSTPKVGLPPLHAARGRLLCQRFAWLRPELRCLAQEFMAQEFCGSEVATADNGAAAQNRGCLAVHIRRSDKGDEAPENMELTEDEILHQTAMTCDAWGCDGVYLASDDWALKARLCRLLESKGLWVATYGAALSPDFTKCTHMEQTLSAHRKSLDVCLEVAVMSACSGLLCTHSFMANMAVYFSHPSYPFRSFWDPPPAPAMRSSPVMLAAAGRMSGAALRQRLVGDWEGAD